MGLGGAVSKSCCKPRLYDPARSFGRWTWSEGMPNVFDIYANHRRMGECRSNNQDGTLTSPSIVRDSGFIPFTDAGAPGGRSAAMDPIVLLLFGNQPNIDGVGSCARLEFANPSWDPGMLTG